MALAKTMDGCDATRGLTAGARLTALVAAVRAPSGVARKVVMRLKNLPRGSTDTYLKSQLVGPEPEGGPLEKLRASVVAWRAYHAHVPAQRVLVIGSGPVGLLTAATLRLSGHEVTVLEKRDPSATDAKSGAYRPRYNLIKLDFVLKKVLDSFGITTERFPSLKELDLGTKIGTSVLQHALTKTVLLLGVRIEYSEVNALGTEATSSHKYDIIIVAAGSGDGKRLLCGPTRAEAGGAGLTAYSLPPVLVKPEPMIRVPQAARNTKRRLQFTLPEHRIALVAIHKCAPGSKLGAAVPPSELKWNASYVASLDEEPSELAVDTPSEPATTSEPADEMQKAIGERLLADGLVPRQHVENVLYMRDLGVDPSSAKGKSFPSATLLPCHYHIITVTPQALAAVQPGCGKPIVPGLDPADGLCAVGKVLLVSQEDCFDEQAGSSKTYNVLSDVAPPATHWLEFHEVGPLLEGMPEDEASTIRAKLKSKLHAVQPWTESQSALDFLRELLGMPRSAPSLGAARDDKEQDAPAAAAPPLACVFPKRTAAPRTPLCAERLTMLEEAFKTFDKDGDAKITEEELGAVMGAAGKEPTEAELFDMMQHADVDCDGTISFPEFLELMERQVTGADEELQYAFDLFDADGDGFIDRAELHERILSMTAVGEALSGEEVDEMIREADLDGNHSGISRDEFVKAMTVLDAESDPNGTHAARRKRWVYALYCGERALAVLRWERANDAITALAHKRKAGEMELSPVEERAVKEYDRAQDEASATMRAVIRLRLFGFETTYAQRKAIHAQVEHPCPEASPMLGLRHKTAHDIFWLNRHSEKLVLVRYRSVSTLGRDRTALNELISRVCASCHPQHQDTFEPAHVLDSTAFEFSSLSRLNRAWGFLRAERQPRPQLVLPVGDSLQEPFWVEGTGVTKGFHSALNATFVANRWAAAVSEAAAIEILTDCTRLFGMLRSPGCLHSFVSDADVVERLEVIGAASAEGGATPAAGSADPAWLQPSARYTEEALRRFGFDDGKVTAEIARTGSAGVVGGVLSKRSLESVAKSFLGLE